MARCPSRVLDIVPWQREWIQAGNDLVGMVVAESRSRGLGDRCPYCDESVDIPLCVNELISPVSPRSPSPAPRPRIQPMPPHASYP